MKRASLKTAKVPVAPSPASEDVTDRLLNRGGTPPRKRGGDVAPKASRPQKKEIKKMTEPHDEPLPYVPYRPVPEESPAPPPGPGLPPMTNASESVEPMADAVEKTRAAVEALQIAGRAAPARYDLAVRYRLDALAHHLQQVADFVTGHAQS
ncbi:MAG: hypothetical protein FJ030_05570 [Chloroflexi bacterium]|nr:hypothetical protein [Chloroflexota bacterium]